jgi:hypothetical protein
MFSHFGFFLVLVVDDVIGFVVLGSGRVADVCAEDVGKVFVVI